MLVTNEDSRDRQIAGSSLEPFLPPLPGNGVVVHQGNDLGYGNNGKDWIIRSQVLRTLHYLMLSMDAVQRLDVGRSSL